MADLDMAARYIETLTGSADTAVTWQTFDDSAEKRGELACVLHGTLDELGVQLLDLNEAGAGVFATVNETDMCGRRVENIVGLRALFADSDNGMLNLERMGLRPSMVVQSVAGQHGYWLLEHGAPLEEFKPAQKRLAALLGTDPKICDLPRVMRVPGFEHCKGERFVVRIVESAKALRYSLGAILACLPDLVDAPAVVADVVAPRDSDENERRAAAWMQRRDPAIEGQGGDQHTFATACALVNDFDLDEDVALEYMRRWNTTCRPPWSDTALLSKVAGARKYATRPRGSKLIERVRQNPRLVLAPEVIAEATGTDDWASLIEIAEEQGAVEEVQAREIEEVHKAANVTQLRAVKKRVSVLEALPDAPVRAGAIVPSKWVLSNSSLVEVEKDGSLGYLAGSPIVVTRWLSGEEGGEKYLEVAWRASGKWHRRIATRKALSAANTIVPALAGYGAPVHSGNAKKIVTYLDAYQRVNNPHAIEAGQYTTHLGWQSGGGFFAGGEAVGCDGLVFHSESDGDAAIVRRVHSVGTLEDWRESMAIVSAWPKVELAVYASLAAPMLELVRAPGFVIDFAGETTTGKTTALCIAASVWGVPDERDNHSLIASWATTEVGLERLAALMSSIPLFIDETKRARVVAGKSVVPECVYGLANGQGKQRGTPTGMQAVRHWRTITLTTGEQSIIDMSEDAGLAGRVLTLWGSPMGGEDDRVAGLTRRLCEAYGTAGPAWVRWLVEHREAGLAEWKARHGQLCEIYRKRLESHGGGRASGRVGEMLAVLELTAELAHPALGLPWEYRSPMSLVAAEIAGGVKTTDKPGEALEYVISMAVQHNEEFWGQRGAATAPVGGWVGRWDDSVFGIFKPVIISWLKKGQFDAKATLKSWAANGILDCDSGHKTKPTKLDGKLTRLVTIRNPTLPMTGRLLPGKSPVISTE